MADNILKNEFMWQEQQKKKKLYKNWKLYAIALGIIVIGTGTGLGIYFGINANHSEVTKIALSTLNTSAITGTENMVEQDAFNDFLENNQEKYTDLASNVEISSFTAPSYTLEGKLVVTLLISYSKLNKPSYTLEGKLVVTTKANSTKYSGSIEVTINAIKQIALTTLNLTFPTIPGTENMKAESVFGIFTYYNPTIAEYVETGTFTAPTYTTDGSLIINAIKDSKYTGSVTAKVNAIGQTNLNDLNLDTSLKQSYTNQQDAFNAFIDLNSTITDLKNNIEAETFTTPTSTTDGLLIINAKANSKYSGNIEINIPSEQETEIVNIINNVNLAFGAYTEIHKDINAFYEEVINSNRNDDPYWYIKGQLTPSFSNYPILRSFDYSKYHFNKLTIDGRELTSDDLSAVGVMHIKFNYDYGLFKNQEANFNLTIS